MTIPELKIPRELVLADTGKGGEIVVEVFENERYLLSSGWSTPTSYVTAERARFSTEDGSHGLRANSLKEVMRATRYLCRCLKFFTALLCGYQLGLPDVAGALEWLEDWKLDKQFDVGCDSEGWYVQ
jgi:hypothetical protein